MSPLFGRSVLSVKLQYFLYAIVSFNKMFIVGQQFIIYFFRKCNHYIPKCTRQEFLKLQVPT